MRGRGEIARGGLAELLLDESLVHEISLDTKTGGL
jgi:hypothetical protein